jgi:CheY-like chemotaxis protein
MSNPDFKSASILIASDKVGDATLVKEMLDDEFDNVRVTTIAEKAVSDFEQHPPEVLLLAFDKLEKAERYSLNLYRQSHKIHSHAHRTITLCSKDEVRQAYALCRSGSFDDYILFWPMINDSARLPMSVHIALRELAVQRDSGPSAAEFAAQARQMAELEALLQNSLAQGDQRLEAAGQAVAQAEACIGAAFEGLSGRLARGELSDMVEIKNADKFGRELARIKSEEIVGPLGAVAQSMAPLAQWAHDFRQDMQPHRESARSLAALAERVEPVILVVDDDEFHRNLMRTLLSQHKFRAVLAASGLDALSSLRKAHADLVLMDMIMPGMDGLQTTVQIKAEPKYARLPIIMATGKSDGNIVRDSLKAGAVDFIVKPIKPAALLAKIARALRQPSKPAAAG